VKGLHALRVHKSFVNAILSGARDFVAPYLVDGMGRLSRADRIDILFNAQASARVSRIFALSCVCFIVAAGVRETRAQADPGASAWRDGPHSRIRLLSATGPYYEGKPEPIAAIEIVLDDGWMTYWRSPAEGLPPTLDWAGSANLVEARILWPAPSRIHGAEGTMSAGYEHHVVFPVVLSAADKGQPMTLHLAIGYNVCGDICIPVEAVLSLDVPQGANEAQRDVIRAALDRVPRKQEPGVYCPHSFIAAARRAVNGRPSLVLKTAFEEKATGLDLFIEGPEGHALPLPSLQPASTRGRSHYVLFFDTEAAVDALLGKVLTLTIVSDQGSCESTLRVK
jgi:DsbC/DsbD-like thiol-disulfide interchange protein